MARAGRATPTARSWVVWGAAVVAYVIAVTHRTSFGVSGLAATGRFGTTATVLSLFVVVQVLVYASLQLPVGVALDRWGSRRMVAIGALVAGGGQLALALAHSVPVAIAARALVGAGDAMTFVSVLRLLPVWFGPRQVPLLAQLTGLLGQLGQVVSAVPFAALLRTAGWTPAYLGLAVLGLAASGISWGWVRDRPAGTVAVRVASLFDGLGATLRSPGTWLGFWSHHVLAFGMQCFTLLWGYPFLVQGEGLTPGTASALLTVMVGVSILAGPVLGMVSARLGRRRDRVVLAVAVLQPVAWAMVLLPSTPRPTWQLVVMVSLVSVGGPASLLGLDLAADHSPPARRGAATGVANAGGFTGALVLVLVIGMVLDHRTGGATPRLADFRVALTLAPAMWLVGITGVLVCRAKVRRLPAPDDLARLDDATPVG